MKITQSRDYKKPIYAIGISAALIAASVSGCGLPVDFSGSAKSSTKEGGRTISQEYSKPNADELPDVTVLAGEVALEGGAVIEEDDDDSVVLAGETTVTENIELAGLFPTYDEDDSN